jgi:hypothetical protein
MFRNIVITTFYYNDVHVIVAICDADMPSAKRFQRLIRSRVSSHISFLVCALNFLSIIKAFIL